MLQTRLSIQSMKISYEINTYKKVSADVFYIIPRGKKCIAWLTMYKNSPEVIFFDLDPRDHTKIKFISVRTLHPSQGFHLSDFQGRGTVLYGTMFMHGDTPRQFFAVENIHVYENMDVDHLNVVEKDELLYKLFSKERASSLSSVQHVQQIQQIQQHQVDNINTQILFGVAVKYGTYAEALKASNTPSIVPYSVYAIQGRFRTQTDNKYYQNCQNQNQSQIQGQGQGQCQGQGQIHSQLKSSYSTVSTLTSSSTASTRSSEHMHMPMPMTKVFMVRPEARVDTYTLRCPVTNNIEHELAHVGDYKTSVLLNSIFRNVKENASLDTAEESDDEETFQNSQEMQISGYVNSETPNLERAMVCSYNYKFKRWVPLHLEKL